MNVICVIIRAALTIVILINTYSMTKYSVKAGISPAVVQTIVILAAFFSALIFYLFYKETLEHK